MNIPERLLNKLKSKQQELALDFLSRPTNRDAFEYGQRSGIINGIEMSINVLLDLLDEEKNSGNDL